MSAARPPGGRLFNDVRWLSFSQKLPKISSFRWPPPNDRGRPQRPSAGLPTTAVIVLAPTNDHCWCLGCPPMTATSAGRPPDIRRATAERPPDDHRVTSRRPLDDRQTTAGRPPTIWKCYIFDYLRAEQLAAISVFIQHLQIVGGRPTVVRRSSSRCPEVARWSSDGHSAVTQRLSGIVRQTLLSSACILGTHSDHR